MSAIYCALYFFLFLDMRIYFASISAKAGTMEEQKNDIEKRLQELIQQKTAENSALNKLLGKLKEAVIRNKKN